MTTEHLRPQSFFNKCVRRAELFTLAFIALTVIVGSSFMQQRQTLNSTAAEPTQAPVSQNSQTIAGYIYLDKNLNGERDTEESGFPGAVIQITQSRRNGTSIPASLYKTDSYGFFKHKLMSRGLPDSTNYTALVTIPSGFRATSKNPIVLEKVPKRAYKIVEFGIVENVVITPTAICKNVTLTGIRAGEACANSSNSYKSISYTCSDGYSTTIGEPTSCKSYDVWKAQAFQDCKMRSCQATPTPTPCVPEPTGYCLPNGPCYIAAPPPGGYCTTPISITPAPTSTCLPEPTPYCKSTGECIVPSKPPDGWCSISPTPTPETIGSCSWCGLDCMDSSVLAGKSCIALAPPEGYACIRENGACQKVPLAYPNR